MGLSGIFISDNDTEHHNDTDTQFHSPIMSSHASKHDLHLSNIDTLQIGQHTHTSHIEFRTEEKIIATIFKASQFDSILPNVFSFLSVVELMFIQTVNRRWHHLVIHARTHIIKRIHYGQFWSRMGILDNSYFITLTTSFKNIIDINLAYCHFITNTTFAQLIAVLPHHERMIRLNIFYCYHLTDDVLDTIVERFPNLTDLNIGRCHLMTERGVMKLAGLTELRVLNLIHNSTLGEDFLMLLDDRTKFNSLSSINVTHCTKLRVEDMDEVKNGRPGLKVLGPLPVFSVDKNGKKMRKEFHGQDL